MVVVPISMSVSARAPTATYPYVPMVRMAPITRSVIIAWCRWLCPIAPMPFIPVANAVPVFFYPNMPWRRLDRAHIYRP